MEMKGVGWPLDGQYKRKGHTVSYTTKQDSASSIWPRLHVVVSLCCACHCRKHKQQSGTLDSHILYE